MEAPSGSRLTIRAIKDQLFNGMLLGILGMRTLSQAFPLPRARSSQRSASLLVRVSSIQAPELPVSDSSNLVAAGSELCRPSTWGVGWFWTGSGDFGGGLEGLLVVAALSPLSPKCALWRLRAAFLWPFGTGTHWLESQSEVPSL